MTSDSVPPPVSDTPPVVLETTHVVAPASAPATLVRGTNRTFLLSSCALTSNDLRDLRILLLRMAQDAANRQVASLTRAVGQSQEDFVGLQNYVRGLLELATTVHGADGDWLGGSGTDVLAERPLPVNMSRIEFDSSFYHRNQTRNAPPNSFTVTLDFRRTAVMESFVAAGSYVNESMVSVSGQDATWVNGVATELRAFFIQRSTERDWLHSPHSYNVASIVGFPLSFLWVYRIDRWFSPLTHALPQPLVVAIYVYIVLLFMFAYRLTFNFARRTFPKIEGPERERGTPWHQRGLLALLTVGILSTALFEALFWLLRLFSAK